MTDTGDGGHQLAAVSVDPALDQDARGCNEVPAASIGAGERRAAVRRELAAGDVASIRDLARRIQAHGIEVTPEALRADVRALGAIRVRHGDDTVLALPVAAAPRPAGRATERLADEVSADPDWSIQVGVVGVVALFLLIGLLGWLLSL